MQTQHTRSTFAALAARALALLVLGCSFGASLQAQPVPPAQHPLLSQPGGNVKPNLVLTMDDSPSMSFTHMPEGTVRVGKFETTVPISVDRSARLHPDDTAPMAEFASGTLASVPGSESWRQRFMRSSDTNSIYYNPRVRYRPWRKHDGTRFPEATWRAAKLDPMASNAAASVNLDATLANKDTTWCFGTSVQIGCNKRTLQFAPGLYYLLKRDPSGEFLDPTSDSNFTEYNLNSSTSSFPRYPDRIDCAGQACTLDEERQNFANWFVYFRTRMLLAKAALAEALYPVQDTLRLGYGRINQQRPTTVDRVPNVRVVESGVRNYTPARKEEVFSWLFGLGLTPSTPLRETIDAVGQYYSSNSESGPWSDTPGTFSTVPQKSCRRAYHLLVTDGYWTDGNLSLAGNADGTAGPLIDGAGGRTYQYKPAAPFKDDASDTLADVAMHYWKRDLRPDLPNNVPPTPSDPTTFWQAMTNFVVGLGVGGTLDPSTDLLALTRGDKKWSANKIDDLWHAAINSRGRYFQATNAAELSGAIQGAVNSVVERELTEAGVVASSQTLVAGARKYVPRYRTGSWSGDVEAVELDANGNAGAKMWSARDGLPAWNGRNIATWDRAAARPGPVNFSWSALSAPVQADIGSSGLLDYIRGDRAGENRDTGYRVREHPLGDFINSTPVFAKGASEFSYGQLPANAGGGAAWAAYLARKRARTGVLYVGGNDGMLHAFQDTLGTRPAEDGREIFAYVPGAVHKQLRTLSERDYGTTSNYHRYFVDGPLREVDAYVKAPGAASAEWRSFVLGSGGAGARAVFAIDSTEPERLGAGHVRWEVSDDKLGHTLFPIEAGVLPNRKWTAVFGNGYGTGEAVLFVVDMETGNVSKLTVDPLRTQANGLGGVTAARDANGFITALYAGDLLGRLWKFVPDAGAASGFRVANEGQPLFSGSNEQPVLQPPAVFDHVDGGKIVVFGTGRLITADDLREPAFSALQAVYGVRDGARGAPIPLEPGHLVVRRITALAGTGDRFQEVFFTLTGDDIDWRSKHGWKVELAVPGSTGLRALYPPMKLSSDAVYVGAVLPGLEQTGETCEGSTGKGINLLFDVGRGLAFSTPVFDTNGDGIINANDKQTAGFETQSDGQDGVLVRTSTGGGGTPPPPPNPPCQYVNLQSTRTSTDARISCAKQPDRIWRRILNPPIR